MTSFNINPNFNMNGFNNSITDFNKIFQDNLSNSQKTLDNSSSFAEIFNSIGQNQPISAGIEQTIKGNMNDFLNVEKIEQSATAKMANDIGKSFANGIRELNAVEKQAEHDFETFASGGDISVHDVMISSQKSSLAMQMAIQLRNQMINAYNEFKQMQV